MGQDEQLLRLVERIYEAVVEPDSWNLFLEELSDRLGGPAIQLSLRLPDREPTSDSFFRFGLDDAYHPQFVKHVLEGLPWGPLTHEAFRGRFGLASEVIGEEDVAEQAFYRDYMEPQGLAPEWPICHLIHAEVDRPLAGIAIYRREGCRPLETSDLVLLDALVPHLSRAYALHCELVGARREREALTEVIDRLPTGVMLLDADANVVLRNRSVEDILALDDGFRLERGRPALSDPQANRRLQALIGAVVASPVSSGQAAGGVLAASRPSGRQPFPVMVGPLLAASPHAAMDEAKAILFIADPETGQVGATDVLEALYQLTHAEAELVRLIADGHSLEEVAAQRGVTMNTVRSQLKQVFAKTNTSRQGELVHLVLAGVWGIRSLVE